MSSKRRASSDLASQEGKEKVEIIPLGAGQEVGRSCFILKYLSKTVMFDCGIHPAHSGAELSHMQPPRCSLFPGIGQHEGSGPEEAERNVFLR